MRALDCAQSLLPDVSLVVFAETFLVTFSLDAVLG